jgi:chemotaxis protein methyltransferase CheR
VTEAEFDFLRGFLKARSGLALSAEKRYLIESRLGPVCRRFGHPDLHALVAALRLGRDVGAEKAVVEAMTTNETFFFRDRSPFDLFRETLLPRAMAARAAQRQIRIWCAAASTGQEPYSLAMILNEAEARLAGWRVEIVATDLSDEVLGRARDGLYSHFEVQRGLPAPLLVKHFEQVGEQWRIKPALRRMVDFRPLNLLNPFASLGTFDIVYCRNVLIYFDAPTKTDVLRRIADVLAPSGSVVLGAAETVIGLTDALRPDTAAKGLYVRSEVEPAHAAPLLGSGLGLPPLRLAVGR